MSLAGIHAEFPGDRPNLAGVALLAHGTPSERERDRDRSLCRWITLQRDDTAAPYLEFDLLRPSPPGAGLSDQGLQQQFELADLDLAVEVVLGAVEDRDGQRAVVAIALEHVDDPGILDLALADADLELPRGVARIAEVDVLDVREDGVVIGAGLGALEEVTGVEGQPQPREGLAELDGDIGIR